MKCRHCHQPLGHVFVDLGSSPPSNAYVAAPNADERVYPLRVLVCDNCWLVQTEDFAGAEELFTGDYAYFSSTSATMLAHAEHYTDAMIARFALGGTSCVAEIAANDGYLLQFVRARGIPCYGVEPTASTAAAARARGIEIVPEFFGVALAARLAAEGRQADLTVANNVLAHVPDINDFVAGFATLLKPQGIATFEFPHLMQLVAQGLFDTIYHEHYSYLSLTAVARIFAANGLAVFDVEELPIHGGSLRVYAQRSGTGNQPISPRVAALLERERAAGMTSLPYYQGFQPRADAIRDAFRAYLIDAKKAGTRVAAYGAAAKGNTLINYAGVGPDLIAFVADRATAKQGKFLPGSHLPIVGEQRLREARPDRIVILPWNIKDEIVRQLGYARDWGARFVVAVPTLTEL